MDVRHLSWDEVLKIVESLKPANEVNTDIELLDQSANGDGSYLKNILRQGDYDQLKKANLSFPILLPAEIPSGAKCAIATLSDNDYMVTFYGKTCTEYQNEGKLSANTNNLPMSEVVTFVRGSLVGTTKCDEIMSQTSTTQGEIVQTIVRNKSGLYIQGATAYSLGWCENGVEYDLFRVPPIKEAVEIGNRLQAINAT